jgi:SAM-dependent methyltransferase
MVNVLPYDRTFFEKIEDGSRQSAKVVVPYLMSLLHPGSVVDVGCGTGGWLSAFLDEGVTDFLGMDGSYVSPSALLIPPSHFQASDLRQPLKLDRRFDLVISLEVGEHLPAGCADLYVDNLVALGDLVVFSAAIPNQGGTGHINEQWPDYWRTRFEARGFVLIDCLRHRFWENRDVERWYRQNLLLYAHERRLADYPALARELEESRGRPLELVHPATYAAPALSAVLHMLSATLSRGIRRRLGKK